MTPFEENPGFGAEQAPLDEPEPAPASVEETAPDQALDILCQYWAHPTQPDEKVFAAILEKERFYFQAMNRRNLIQMMRLAYATYYGFDSGSGNGDWEAQQIKFTGENEELLQYCVNEFRSFVDQIVNMMVKNRPAFQGEAINNDSVSMGGVEAAESAVKYYFEQVYGERKEKEVVKSEVLYGKGVTVLDWDPDGGSDIEIESSTPHPLGGEPVITKETVKSGAFLVKRFFPWQISQDPFRSEQEQHLWKTTIEAVNKWEVIARYPLFAQKISEMGSNNSASEFSTGFPGADPSLNSEDAVIVRTLHHPPSAVLPEGRLAKFVEDVKVDDGPYPIDTFMIVDFMSCELDQTCFGISDLWNLIPEQQMNNQILSDIATNTEAHGRPPLAVFQGSDIDLDALANGQKVITLSSPEHVPQLLNFSPVNETPIKLVQMNRQFMQALSGLNAIFRGEADASVKSGAHAALYHAMAVENQAPRQANLDLHRERVANIILKLVKKFAKHPQLVAITGASQRPYLQYLSQKDFAGVERVVIKTANPMMRTQAGKMAIAEILRDWPGQPLKNPAEIVELITTGQFASMLAPQQSASLRIRRENELLSAAPPVEEVPTGEIDPATGLPKTKKTVPTVPVLPTDHPVEHIWGHVEGVNAPDIRDNPAKLDAYLTHIFEHFETWFNGNPFLYGLLGMPMPPSAGAGMMPGQEGKGPSDKDMAAASEAATPPATKPAFDEEDDSTQSAFGNVPKPSKSPV